MSSLIFLAYCVGVVLTVFSETMATWTPFTMEAKTHNVAQTIGVMIVHLTVAAFLSPLVIAQNLVGFLISMFVWGKTVNDECFAFNKWNLMIRKTHGSGRHQSYTYRSIFSTKPQE